MSPLAERLRTARAQTDALFGLIDPTALYDRPVPDRHRLIFYLGHVEAFDWNLFSQHALGKSSFHPSFDKLFAFGIDPEPGQAAADQPSDWPREQEVRDYAARVRRELDGSLHQTPDQLIHVAIEHRYMHAETLAYLFHNLPYEKKFPGRAPRPEARALTEPALAEPAMIEIPAGVATLGRPRGEGFGWDNEFDRHQVQAPAFRISKYKTTNGEYLEFVRAGASPPHFWIERDRQFFLRTMFEEIPLPLDWPVYVTQAEAGAYARWRGKKLPSEVQYHRAAEGASPVNVDFENWDPVPAGESEGESRYGVAQMLGNGWEWTSTVFAPFAGFEPFSFYRGYSADFFDGKHFVMKGGSPRTARCLLRRSFRNWFRADYPYVYAGFRLTE
ncbi:MAG TPA: SUMF1/EgtB/PvdO family nonheme iron enzyme, partial [Bryobacteraceae bacterium]|nr:SUMF1/EgtB/PvdO family nonheme iron enzyme [Bryobacteraceae bacterium]